MVPNSPDSIRRRQDQARPALMKPGDLFKRRITWRNIVDHDQKGNYRLQPSFWVYARRKFWQNYTVAGGKLDEKGQSKGWNISKSAFRAMIDSALGLRPDDLGEAARARRVIGGLKQLDGIIFAARIMVEASDNGNYRDANKIANVVLPNEPAYAAIMRGETVAPEPVNAPPRKAAAQVPAAWAAQAPAQGGWSGATQAPVTRAPVIQAQPATAAPAFPQSGTPAWLNS